jgi:transposase-like protein
VSHRNARLTVHGRRLRMERVRSGRPVAHVAAEMGLSRPTAHKWIRRWRSEGDSGLVDRSSRPRTTPHRTTATTEARVCRLRQARKLGPARLGRSSACLPRPSTGSWPGTASTAWPTWTGPLGSSQHRTHHSPDRLPPHLQPPPQPHRTRRPATHHPCQQRSGSIQLGPVRRADAFTSRRGGTYGLWVTQSSSAGQRCAQSGGSVLL